MGGDQCDKHYHYVCFLGQFLLDTLLICHYTP
jgi:hypothetical protein